MRIGHLPSVFHVLLVLLQIILHYLNLTLQLLPFALFQFQFRLYYKYALHKYIFSKMCVFILQLYTFFDIHCLAGCNYFTCNINNTSIISISFFCRITIY
eukprot:532732_1